MRLQTTGHCPNTVGKSALKLTREGKSLASPGTRTRVSIAPDVSNFLHVTRSHEMSLNLKFWQFEITTCLKSAGSARYFDT